MGIRKKCLSALFLPLLVSCAQKGKPVLDTRTPGNKEASYAYTTFFLPEKDGTAQPYVGDTMPYAEDGTYYIYYLKEGGDSYNHSVYLLTTRDFTSYEEHEGPVLEASRDGGQDAWIGTGSVVKVNGRYLFFYTGHSDSPAAEYKETILVAEGDSPYSFEKKRGWEIVPPAGLGQKTDFRDPQAYYDAGSGKLVLTVTASKDNIARILKFSLDPDLGGVQYEGIMFSDPTRKFWNLECSDTFRIGDKYYLTYSAQDDTLWYALADSPYGPWRDAARLDDRLFYAAKHVSSDAGTYMVGWARRSESPSSTQEVSGWAGNLLAQKIIQRPDGTLHLAPVDAVAAQYTAKHPLLGKKDCEIRAGTLYAYADLAACEDSFRLEGEFSFSGSGSFGLAFDYNGRQNKYKLISLSPAEQKIQLLFNEGSTLIAESAAQLEPGRTYSFTYIQDGSVGVFYIDGIAALTARLYGTGGNTIRLFAENNAVRFISIRQYTK